jgi:phage terminase large subunit-like protein
MNLSEWLAVEQRIDASQVPDAPALLDRLPRAFVENLSPLEALSLRHDHRACLRGRQLPPADLEWLVWALITGRAWGKSYAAAGWLIAQIMACTPSRPRDFMLVAPRLQDCEDLQWSVVEALLPPWVRAVPRTSHQQILFPDHGVRLFFHSADNSHARGKNLAGLWAEEVIAWPGGGKTLWQNLMRSLRVPGPSGEPARAVITTTPPYELTHWLLPLLAQPTTRTTRGTARDNPHNSKANIESWYAEDTIEARRENDGAFIFGVDGALFKLETLERFRVESAPALSHVVISLDPTQSAKADADTVGLVAMGIAGGHGYILESYSERMAPEAWAERAIDMAERHRARCYVIEPTGSGFLPETVLRQQFRIGGRGDRLIVQSKARGPKGERAQPLSSAAAQGRLHIVGHQEALEREMTTWFPGASFSPGALDAAAHAWLHLTHYGKGNQL